jgi:hypothetical protein
VRYEEAARLKASGMSINRIAAALGAERKTIRRWLRAGGAALWRKPQHAGRLGPYQDYLTRVGTRGAATPLSSGVNLSHRASLAGLERCGTGLDGGARAKPEAANAPTVQIVPIQPPSARQLARLLITDERRPEVDPSFGTRQMAQLPRLAECVAVTKRLILAIFDWQNMRYWLSQFPITPSLNRSASPQQD